MRLRLDITKLDHKLSVAGQISIDDIAEIATAGGSGQVAGYSFVYLPIRIGSIPTERAEAFQKLMVELPKPVLAFCSSGMRATALYGMTQQNVQDDTGCRHLS